MPNVENDAHRCPTPALAWPGDEWTCRECGVTYWADDQDDDETFAWRVIPPGADHE